jgi:hypothetical protein
MKVVRHVQPRDRLLHIETEGGIVNIRTGLTDRYDRAVTSVEVLPDRGDEWTLDGYHNNRLIEGVVPVGRLATFHTDDAESLIGRPLTDQEYRSLVKTLEHSEMAEVFSECVFAVCTDGEDV